MSSVVTPPSSLRRFLSAVIVSSVSSAGFSIISPSFLLSGLIKNGLMETE